MELVEKTELHIHLGGSWPLSYLESVADHDDFDKLEAFLDQMEKKGDDTDYHACFGAFSLAGKIVDDIGKVEDGTCAMCKGFAADGVTYVELRTGLKNMKDTGYEAYLLSVLRGIERGCSDTSLKVVVILSLKRNSSRDLAQETLRLIKKYRTQVVGLDVSDDALLGDASSIVEIISDLQASNIPVALHLGECKEETEEQQMRELETFQPQRIGHGVFLCEKAKEWIFARRLPIEMCLSSSIYAHMIDRPEQHPALELLKSGYPVCVCTDDPLIFRTSHTKENEMARQLLEYSVEQMATLHKQSLQYKFS